MRYVTEMAISQTLKGVFFKCLLPLGPEPIQFTMLHFGCEINDFFCVCVFFKEYYLFLLVQAWLLCKKKTNQHLVMCCHKTKQKICGAFPLIYLILCWSGITLWPPTGEVNNTDYLFIMAPLSWWEKMDKRKLSSEFDNGRIVMARWLGQSISKAAALVGFSQSAVVSIYQKWSREGRKEGRVVTLRNRVPQATVPSLVDARRLARVVPSNRAVVAQIAKS